MTDRFSGSADEVSAPATRAVAVTPHDSQPLADVPKALFVGTGGTIVMRGARDTADATFVNIPDGSVVPFRPSHVRQTGTTARDLLALY